MLANKILVPVIEDQSIKESPQKKFSKIGRSLIFKANVLGTLKKKIDKVDSPVYYSNNGNIGSNLFEERKELIMNSKKRHSTLTTNEIKSVGTFASNFVQPGQILNKFSKSKSSLIDRSNSIKGKYSFI